MIDAKWLLLAAVVTLTGCGTSPASNKAGLEPEVRLSMAKPKAKAPTAKEPPVAPGRSSQAPLRDVATAVPAQPVTPAARDQTLPSESAVPVGRANTQPTEAPSVAVLTILGGPTQSLHLMVMRGPDDVALDVLSDPEDGLATFMVQGPPQGIAIAKAKIELTGVDKPASVVLTREELEWPKRVAGRTPLPVPILLYETLRVLSENPTATKVSFKTTLLGEDDQPLRDSEGEPLTLKADASVF